MKNSRDKNILKLLLIFLAYYLISFYMPNVLINHSKLMNMILKDLIMIIVATIIYFKDVIKEFRSFRRSKNKYNIVLWALGIIIVWYLTSYLVAKNFPNLYKVVDGNSNSFMEYYNISKFYTFFKVVIFTGIVEVILFNLSFRKVFRNDFLFIIVSSLVYTYFNYLFVGFDFKYILNPLILRFIPCFLYNIAYIKNKNNIIFLMGIIIFKNTISFVLVLLGL